MNNRNIFLSAILLVLIGLTLGTLTALFILDRDYIPTAEVRFTEVKRSDEPFIEKELLEKYGGPFVFKKVAEEVTSTVVYIETIVPVRGRVSRNQENESEESLFERIVPRRARTVGSGIVISKDGYVLTNNHVIDDAVRNGITVVLNDKREFSAKIIGKDPSTDLAVLKIDATDIPSITVGNSDKVEVGEWVVAVGNPFRLRATVTAGIVSALSRDMQIINDNMRIESFIQTDAAINKGNSGGALVNMSGQLIGVNTAIASQSGSYQGYGFAVPSNLAMKVASDLIEYGVVKRALLGVNIASVDYNRALQLGLSEVRGVEIVGLTSGGAAEEYGIKVGDVVLKVNNSIVDESNQLQEKIASLKPGEFADLNVLRDGRLIDVRVQLKEFIEPVMAAAPVEEELDFREFPNEGRSNGIEFYKFNLGFRVMSIATSENPAKFDLVIVEVDRFSEAWKRGLRKDLKILEVEQTKVEDLAILRDLIIQKFTDNNSVLLKTEDADGVIGYFQLKN